MWINFQSSFFKAGGYINGSVNINAKYDINASQVCLRFEGREEAKIITVSKIKIKKKKKTASSKLVSKNEIQFYCDQFSIAQVDDGIISKGQHAFPFRFLLPNTLPGSTYNSPYCKIMYKLTGFVKFKSNQQQLRCEYKLHIIENFRKNKKAIFNESFFTPKCLGCCKTLGGIKSKLRCNKNVVKPGDQIQIACEIDNIKGHLQLRFVNLKLVQTCFVLLNNNLTKEFIQNVLYIKSFNNISEGEIFQTLVATRIPQEFSSPTVIGSICARYFYIQLITQCGDPCPQNSRVRLYLFVDSQEIQQQFEDSEQYEKPLKQKRWKPIVHNNKLSVNQNLKSFVYQYNLKMPFHNQFEQDHQELQEKKNIEFGYKKANNLSKMDQFNYPPQIRKQMVQEDQKDFQSLQEYSKKEDQQVQLLRKDFQQKPSNKKSK